MEKKNEKLKVKNLLSPGYFYLKLSNANKLHFLCMYSACDTAQVHMLHLYFFKGFIEDKSLMDKEEWCV